MNISFTKHTPAMTTFNETTTADMASAAALMQERGEASVSLLQRHFKLGHANAKDLFNQVKLAGLLQLNPISVWPKPDMAAVRRVVAAARSGLESGERDRLSMTGALLYSQLFSLSQGETYILGTNPGGGDIDKPRIKAVLERMERGQETDNDYLDDETWDTPNSIRLQNTIKAVLHLVAPGRERTVCASNLVFVRSGTVKVLEAKTEGFWALANACWPAHEAILDVVRPKMIVSYGNGPGLTYAYLRHRFWSLDVKEEKNVSLNGGAISLKAFSYSAPWGRTRVVGLPHPSRFGLLESVPKDGESLTLRPHVAEFISAP